MSSEAYKQLFEKSDFTVSSSKEKFQLKDLLNIIEKIKQINIEKPPELPEFIICEDILDEGITFDKFNNKVYGNKQAINKFLENINKKL